MMVPDLLQVPQSKAQPAAQPGKFSAADERSKTEVKEAEAKVILFIDEIHLERRRSGDGDGSAERRPT